MSGLALPQGGGHLSRTRWWPQTSEKNCHRGPGGGGGLAKGISRRLLVLSSGRVAQKRR